MDICTKASPFPARNHPAGERLHLRACTAQGRILSGLDPQKQTVLSETDIPP